MFHSYLTQSLYIMQAFLLFKFIFYLDNILKICSNDLQIRKYKRLWQLIVWNFEDKKKKILIIIWIVVYNIIEIEDNIFLAKIIDGLMSEEQNKMMI